MFLASKASGWVHVDRVSPPLLLLWQPTDCWVAADHKMAQVTWPKSVRSSYSHFADEITSGGSRDHKLGSIQSTLNPSIHNQQITREGLSLSSSVLNTRQTVSLSLFSLSLSPNTLLAPLFSYSADMRQSLSRCFSVPLTFFGFLGKHFDTRRLIACFRSLRTI